MTPPRHISRILLALALSACGAKDEPQAQPAPVQPTANPTPVAPPIAPAGDGSGSAKNDGKKGDKQDSEWVPAEYKTGAAKWKDTGVYLDGKIVGFLSWGELPIATRPTWNRDKISANKRAGTNDPGWRWAQQRYYKFNDYLKGIGVDSKKIKEMHVYGPKLTESLIITGADLQLKEAAAFGFRFGSNVGGKAIPIVPADFGGGRPADKIAGVMIYIEKTPPKLVTDVGFVLDGQNIEGVPYFGDPVRGGVRIYLDDKYAAMVKRQELDPKKAVKDADGELTWSLGELLASQGVDTKKAVEVYVIRDELRQEKLPASELATLRFAASSQAKGGILLGDKKLRANALAIHTRALKPDELPYVTPDDD